MWSDLSFDVGWKKEMNMRVAILLVLIIPAWFCAFGAAQELDPRERALALLKSAGKHDMTETEAREVASLGTNVLPIVYDALSARPPRFSPVGNRA